jgi:methionyl-tRNA formyltransferase
MFCGKLASFARATALKTSNRNRNSYYRTASTLRRVSEGSGRRRQSNSNNRRTTTTRTITTTTTTRASSTAKTTEEERTTTDMRPKRIAFLGTPEVAAKVFNTLCESSQKSNGLYEVCAVISQPGKPRGRGRTGDDNKPLPSPVTQKAIDNGFDDSQLLNPMKANEEEFLELFRKMDVDLCVTAAYGNFLPRKFLTIPKYGTLNIHPSLLPQFRGAAPVQRAIEQGVEETGVTVAFTVLKMDAGPILTQTKYKMKGSEKAHEMLDILFDMGVNSLIEKLPIVFTGEAANIAKEQGEETVSHADKVSSEEGNLDFSKLSALEAHNKVRAFDGWPGTKATFLVKDDTKGETKEIVAKILTTKVGNAIQPGDDAERVVVIGKKQFSIPCKKCGNYLDVLEIQPPGKKAMDIASFVNGLKGASVSLI